MIQSNIKSSLENELKAAKELWVATAMISKAGWNFIQNSLPKLSTQHYLIGIDLATDPGVFEDIFKQQEINARVYETNFTFHPKVYLIRKADDTLTAFVGSSNTTTWGLEKNIEMNFQINDQLECQKLLTWFNTLYPNGYLITEKFISNYKLRFKRISPQIKQIQEEASELKLSLTQDDGQYFSSNEHEIFYEKYHRVNSDDLKNIRRTIREKLLKLHNNIYPKFPKYGLTDIHGHHNASETVSRHFFNRFSGNYINAMWLHYGKSKKQLAAYASKDKSINKPESFINNIRLQVIVREDFVGFWLVLGKNLGSIKDREHFRKQIANPKVLNDFFNAFKMLEDEYWISVPNAPVISMIKTPDQLVEQLEKETINDYFIIGKNINLFDNRLSVTNLPETVLNEFRKLYPLYEIMRHK